MEKKKTVLLLCPYLLARNGRIWDLMHIIKEKNATILQKEPLNTVAVRKYFPRIPDIFSTTLNRFSEKQLEATRAEISIARGQMETAGNEDDWIRTALTRKLHSELTSLRPFLAAVPCYHQVPAPEDPKRMKTSPCVFSSFTPNLHFQVRRQNAGHLYIEPEIRLNGTAYPIHTFNAYDYLLENRNEYFLLRYQDYLTLQWLSGIDWKNAGTDMAFFSEEILNRLEKDHTVDRNGLLGTHAIDVTPEGRVLLSEISGQFLMLTPQFVYDGHVSDGIFKETEEAVRDGKQLTIIRKKEAEQTIIAQVEALHPNFRKQTNGYYYLSFAEAQKRHWFLKVFRQLLDMDIEVAGMDMLKHFRYCPERPVTILETIKEDGDYVQMRFALRFAEETISFNSLQKVIRAGHQALPLKDGSIALLEEDWLSKYGIVVKHALPAADSIRVPRWLALSLERNEGSGDALRGVLKKDWWNRWRQWQQSEEPLYKMPATVNATLRLYQQKGFEWLMLLNEIGAGMFLADDMGLGKTLQTICFVAAVLESDPASKILIVCPASLIYNWEHELTRFAASLRHCVYHGAARDREVLQSEDVSIIISSYGTLRADSAVFLSRSFSAVILDESHTIKNPSSQITKLVHDIRADRRLTLSGTPVMNNTFDLYSQLQFILPGMFGSQQFFKREYADPIDRDRNEQRAQDLKKLTAPFILRRTKEQVAQDLPPKTEMVFWCDMEPGQQQVYIDIRDRVKNELRSTIREQGLQKSKLQVLQGILKLRQVCNSPELLRGEDYQCRESVKTRELLEEIENNLSNHRALVFSQFTSMLDILAAELAKKQIPFLLLTGSTPAKERDRMVREFNEADSPCRIFLLSLKAGNAGLNLTSADYVFLFDPWWNSAVEQQAIDRTHRIGQTKKVFAYKMVCRDTIEEWIIRLQEQKKELAGTLVAEEEGFVKALTEEDIEYLLR